MKAKPKKCISTGLKNGKQMDPCLKVWLEKDEWFPKFLGDGFFKFLGKGILGDLSSDHSKATVKKKFEEYTKLIDKTLLSGIEKIWIWEHIAMPKVGWDFLIHDFPPSYVKLSCSPFKRGF